MVNKIRNGIVWVRTPKCATTTIAHHIKKFCIWKGIEYIDELEHGIMPGKGIVNLGHLWSGDVNWNVVKQESRGVMGSVRHPLSRFLSHYKHHLREDRYKQYDDNVSLFYLENYHNTHFEPYFRGMDNYICKYLGVGDDDTWSSEAVLLKYDFLTVAEKMEQSLVKFQNFTGYKFEDKDLIKNKTDKDLIITNEFVELFEERNKNDYELYDFTLKHFKF